MELLFESRPETCLKVGLDCGTCIHAAAASVAGICCGLDSTGVQQVFFQMYPSPGCRPMAHAFALAYQESSDAQRPRFTVASAAA